MKTLIIFSIFCLLNNIYAQTDSLINQIDSQGLKQGKWIFFENNFEMLYNEAAEIQIDFLNDTIHGNYSIYDLRGILRFKYNVCKGNRIGTGYEYYKSGKIYRIFYHSSDLEAYTIQFNSKGQLYSEYYQKEGKTIISYKTYKKGKLYMSKGYNEDGQLDGPFIYYYMNGQVKHVLMFDANKLRSQKRYSRSGKIKYNSDNE